MEEPSFDGRRESDGSSKPKLSDFSSNLLLKETGLRAGWRLLIYAVAFLAFLATCTFFSALLFRLRRDVFSPAFQFSEELLSFFSAIGAAWVMSMIEERPLGAYGFPARVAFGKLFWQGCLFGLIEIASLIGAIAAFGGYSFGSLAGSGWNIAGWALYWGSFFIVVGFAEEFFFRGYTLYTLAEGIGFWPAAVLLSCGFGWVHRSNEGENWMGVAGVVLVGLFWSFTLKRTGSLWFALGMHAMFDFGETFLFSVPDSGMVSPWHLSNATLHGPNWLTGGTPGPEASVIDFLILAVFFVVFNWLYPARRAARPSIALDSAA